MEKKVFIVSMALKKKRQKEREPLMKGNSLKSVAAAEIKESRKRTEASFHLAA